MEKKTTHPNHERGDKTIQPKYEIFFNERVNPPHLHSFIYKESQRKSSSKYQKQLRRAADKMNMIDRSREIDMEDYSSSFAHLFCQE